MYKIKITRENAHEGTLSLIYSASGFTEAIEQYTKQIINAASLTGRYGGRAVVEVKNAEDYPIRKFKCKAN
jgi:hypothetical protein